MITGKENYQILNGYVTMVTELCFLFIELQEQRNNLRCLLKEMTMDSRRETAAYMAILALKNRTKKKTTKTKENQ